MSLPDGPVRPTRAARRRAGRRRTLVVIGAVAAMLVVIALVFAQGGDDPTPTTSPSRTSSGRPTPSSLVLLSVTGADHALVAVAGSGGDRDPAAFALEPGTTIVVPGQGETVLEDLVLDDGDAVRIGVANAIGAWISHYLVLDLDGLGTVVDRAGGLRVDLSEAVTLRDEVVGPGETLLNGAQIEAYLAAEGDDAGLRWRGVVEALLAQVPAITPADLDETDDAADATATFTAAKGASADTLPTEVVLATVLVLQQPESDGLVQEAFGVAPPHGVLIQNGSGAPGVGEDVARLLLPEGFRVVLSQNAEDFDHEVTEIIASDQDAVQLARRVRRILGVGLVEVAQVPSGLAEVTIVVGKDFEG